MNTLLLLAVVGLYQANAFLFPKVKTVDTLDLNKYTGRWYEAYSTLVQKATFQRNSYCTSATYTINGDGTVKVFNAGRIGSATGKANEIIGVAKVVDAKVPGALNVKFATGPQGDSANYLVVKLGPATFGKDGLYEYTVISSPKKFLAWVLVRDVKDFKAKYETEVLAYLKDNAPPSTTTSRSASPLTIRAGRSRTPCASPRRATRQWRWVSPPPTPSRARAQARGCSAAGPAPSLRARSGRGKATWMRRCGETSVTTGNGWRGLGSG